MKNIDPKNMSRRRTLEICLVGKRAKQSTAEVKSTPVANPSHVIVSETNMSQTAEKYGK